MPQEGGRKKIAWERHTVLFLQPTPGGGYEILFPYTHDRNSIAFGSAPRREADSQPISQLDRPAVSQTETHSLGFLSVADPAPASGENHCPQGKQWPNGNAAERRLFGRRFEPERKLLTPPPPPTPPLQKSDIQF